jgi:hypothetical protein
MKHHGFEYKLGWNIDTLPFNPSGLCSYGGLYFTDLCHLHEYVTYGDIIATVHLLPTEKVYTEYHKYKAHLIFISKMELINDFMNRQSYNVQFDSIIIRKDLFYTITNKSPKLYTNLLKHLKYTKFKMIDLTYDEVLNDIPYDTLRHIIKCQNKLHLLNTSVRLAS